MIYAEKNYFTISSISTCRPYTPDLTISYAVLPLPLLKRAGLGCTVLKLSAVVLTFKKKNLFRTRPQFYVTTGS